MRKNNRNMHAKIICNLRKISAIIKFEIHLQKKKIIYFSILAISMYVVIVVMPYVLIPNTSLPPTQYEFYQLNRGYMSYIYLVLLLINSFVFSGIINSEYKQKTALNIFPLVSKFKIYFGKFIANFLILIGIYTIHYLVMALFSYYFYGEPIFYTLIFSFGLFILYSLVLASITTFLSSFMASPISVLITIMGLILIGFDLINLIPTSLGLEPIYSLSYLDNIINYILYPNFSSLPRYIEYYEGSDLLRRWLFPSLGGALFVLSLYSIIFLLVGFILFKRRDL